MIGRRWQPWTFCKGQGTEKMTWKMDKMSEQSVATLSLKAIQEAENTPKETVVTNKNITMTR